MQKSKGYYRALCACLGLLVVGGATAYYGISQSSEKPSQQKTSQQPIENRQESKQASASAELPNVEQVIINRSPSLTEAKTERQKQQEKAGETAQEPQTAENEAVEVAEAETAMASVQNTEPSFAKPLSGELVMDYNMEHAIFDPTLEQFRTNNCISIAGNEGDVVKASEDGTVSNVVEQVERGITVVIQHNNGWETTYSQLKSDVKVKKGDTVKKGQDIGMIAQPTKYGSALGNHLDFAVIKDGQYVDPKNALAQ